MLQDGVVEKSVEGELKICFLGPKQLYQEL